MFLAAGSATLLALALLVLAKPLKAFTAVGGRNLLTRRQGWHEAIHEWQGGSEEIQARSLRAHIPSKNPSSVPWMLAYITWFLRR